jgi:hypothetical protein
VGYTTKCQIRQKKGYEKNGVTDDSSKFIIKIRQGLDSSFLNQESAYKQKSTGKKVETGHST